MPHTNTWEPEGIYRQFTGMVSGEEILKSNFELHGHEDFLDIKYVINDFTQVSGHAVEPIHTKVYASTDEIIAMSKGRMKIALVVDREPFISIAQDYVAHMEGNVFECRIFPTLDEARQWVNT